MAITPKSKKNEIVLEFDMKTGEVKGEAIGYQGTACSLDMGPIMDAAGKLTKRTPKAPEKEQVVVRTQRS